MAKHHINIEDVTGFPYTKEVQRQVCEVLGINHEKVVSIEMDSDRIKIEFIAGVTGETITISKLLR